MADSPPERLPNSRRKFLANAGLLPAALYAGSWAHQLKQDSCDGSASRVATTMIDQPAAALESESGSHQCQLAASFEFRKASGGSANAGDEVAA